MWPITLIELGHMKKTNPVSYTHLDVYKRQEHHRGSGEDARLHQRDEGHGLCVFPDQRPGPYGPVSYTHLDVYKRQEKRTWIL